MSEHFAPDEVDYADDRERRRYLERGYPKNARPYSESQTGRRLCDLVRLADRCRRLVARGERAFFADDEEGEILRAAGERYIVGLGNVVEKLHSDYKDRFPQVPWQAITGMRNLVAHHYDKVDPAAVWDALRLRVPALLAALDLAGGHRGDRHREPGRAGGATGAGAAADPFPGPDPT